MSIPLLRDLIDNNLTDKNTLHSYLDTYDKLFGKIRNTAKAVMEIGIQKGGSIKLWLSYFINATVYGLDITPMTCDGADRLVLHTGVDAYSDEFFDKIFANSTRRFDMILDDGPHTLESMQQFIQKYSQLLAPGGILVIEDVQSIDWIPILTNSVPYAMKKNIQVFDLRNVKGRYDDIIFTTYAAS